jgi:CubicO group peptidase (beta-lactamase class C family)
MTAICAHRLVEAGKLDLDAPVARYWPEFAQAGKERLPVRHLLNHQAGLAGARKPLADGALYDWDAMCAALAESEPWWEPGTKHGYHALTFGHLVGEVIRRIDGRSGTPASEHARIADVIPAPPAPSGAPDTFERFAQDPGSLTYAAFNNPPSRRGAVNSKEWREAEIPAGNGHGDARSLARLYGALARDGVLDGVRVLAPETTRRARQQESLGKDAVLGFPTRFGLGFMLRHPFLPLGPNPNAFGHPGAGGSIAFADPDRGLGFAYVMNQMQEGLAGDPRGWKLIQATYASLAG